MNFTAKEDYSLRAVLDLAVHSGSGLVQAHEIAQRQHIPEPFLEQLLASLRRAQVVRSTRGPTGGYALAGSADSITVGQVLRALSGPLVPAKLVTGSDDDVVVVELVETVIVRAFWDTMRTELQQVCDGMTIQDLLDRRSHRVGDSGFMMNI